MRSLSHLHFQTISDKGATLDTGSIRRPKATTSK